jgi:hypothetical protein
VEKIKKADKNKITGRLEMSQPWRKEVNRYEDEIYSCRPGGCSISPEFFGPQLRSRR